MSGSRKKLGRYIIAAFFLNIFAIMSVGAMCILLVGDMLHNIQQIRMETDHIFRADEINNKIYKTIYAIDQAVITGDSDHLIYARDIIIDVIDELTTFMVARQGAEHDLDELDKLNDVLASLVKFKGAIRDLLESNTGRGVFDPVMIRKLDKLGTNVQVMSEELRDHHSPLISTLVDDSYHKMRFILLLYLLSSLIGILASVVAYMVLTRNTVSPIMDLAKATKDVAEGDLSVRVATSSETEIGALYDSFNVMTEKLELHAREREAFNIELGRLVEERTIELQEANRTLRETQSELVRMEKIAALGQIAASVNHEIKTPLNSLYLNLQLLTRKINKYEWPEEKPRESLLSVASTIDKEIIRISEILEEFVQYARFAPPKVEEEDINQIIGELALMIEENAKDVGVELKLDLVEGALPALLDSKKFTQALLNLSVNAIHAMPNGGTLTIISDRSVDGKSIIRITDTGSGIDEEDLEKIFEPFFTNKEKGMGFGLPIVRRIIEDHHGTITCRSEIENFTEFEIILPAFTVSEKA
jgi:nitrogen fixation/metabolism regulation signal transduction histidine kinase